MSRISFLDDLPINREITASTTDYSSACRGVKGAFSQSGLKQFSGWIGGAVEVVCGREIGLPQSDPWIGLEHRQRAFARVLQRGIDQFARGDVEPGCSAPRHFASPRMASWFERRLAGASMSSVPNKIYWLPPAV